MRADNFHDLRFDVGGRLAFGHSRQILAAQIGCQHDDAVGEVHRTALAIGQTPIVQHLQQDIEDVAVRLLNFIKQDHLIGSPPDCFGQNSAFFVADIARRGTDQPRD